MVDVFNRSRSQSGKDIGMALASDARAADLDTARKVAKKLARLHGEVHADMVGRVLHKTYGIKSLGPAAGSIFKTKDWVWTGKRVMSSRTTNHRRELKVWKLAT